MIRHRTPLDYALFQVGGLTGLATLIGVTKQAVWRWTKTGFPVHRAEAIEQATNGIVSRQIMFPNEFALLWPALARGKHPGWKVVSSKRRVYTDVGHKSIMPQVLSK